MRSHAEVDAEVQACLKALIALAERSLATVQHVQVVAQREGL
jgi:hypothetical protein